MSAAPENHFANYEVKAGLAEVEAFDIVGISVRTQQDKAAEDINALWEQFFKDSIGQKVNHKIDDVIFAVYSDYEGGHEDPYRVTIGYRVKKDGASAAAQGFHHVTCEGGDYAILSAAGQQPQALIQTWESIWASDLDRTYKTDFEVYGPKFFEDGLNEVLIHIGVK